MKRIISLLLTLCLLAGCGLAAAEDRVPEGKPWINSNVLGNLPDERPAVEDGFDLYVNYDAYTEARDKGTEAHAALAERMKEYDEYYPVEAAEWPEGKIVTIEQLKERSPLAYAQAVGMGLVKEGTPMYIAPENRIVIW